MKFSLIIPHHGDDRLLDRLLKSIPDRDDLETIVIRDDKAKGAGWARNKGLEHAVGEYVLFADSDDYFTSGFYQLLDELQTETADIIFFNAHSITEGTGKPSWRADRLNWIMKQPADRREFFLRHTFTEPWCHIVRHSLIEQYGIRFDEGPMLEDVAFTTMAGYHAQTIKADSRVFYCICDRAESNGKRLSAERLVTHSKVLAKANQFNKIHSINYYHIRMVYPVFYCMTHWNWSMALKCCRTIIKEGYTWPQLTYRLLTFPFSVIGWTYRKWCYARAREENT